MRKLAIFAGGYAVAVFTAVLVAPQLDRQIVGGVCAGIALLLALLRRVLPDKPRRRALLCCMGMALGMLWTGGYDRLVVEPVRQLDDTTIVLSAVVSDWPEETEYGIKVRTKVDLPSGRHADGLLYMDKCYASLQPGDRVSTVAHCKFSNETDSDRQVNYNTAKGILLVATAYGEAEVEHPEQLPITTAPAYAMDALRQGIAAAFPGRIQALVRAIVTGDRSELDSLMVSGLKRTGLTHAVAVSGMHLAFLAGCLELLLGRGRRRTALVTIPVVILFVLMIGSTPSAIRAVVMLILLQLAPLFGREGDTPTSLMLALFLLLAHNPYACADVGLQLSFCAVAGIALFAQNLQDYMTQWLNPGRGIKRLRNGLLRAGAAIVAVTLGAQVFTVPLTAYYFDIISLVSPLANVLCAWAVCALFILGAGGGLLGMLLPGVACAVSLLATPIGDYIRHIVIWLAQFNFAAIPARPELYRLWLVLVYLLLALALILPGKKRKTVPCLTVLVALVAAIFCTTTALRTAAVQMDVLDVGQGQSVLLRSGKAFVLVDCGGDSYHQAGDIAADQLQNYGCGELDLLVLTHYHDDHANGVPGLLKRVNVKRIALPDVEPESSLRQEILDWAERKNVDILFVRTDVLLQVGRMKLTLYPPLGEIGANEMGLTVLCSRKDQDVLITGDMTAEVEQKLLAYTDLPDVEVMVAGHHGSKYSNSTQLLEAVRPELAIFSVGAYNTYGHPTTETLDRFWAVGATCYRTDTMGRVTLTVDP